MALDAAMDAGDEKKRLGPCRFTLVFFSLMGFFAVSFFLAPALLPHDYHPEIGEEEGKNNRANMIDFSDNWSEMREDGHYYQTIIYYFGDFNCHQLPERSIKINGNQMPVCTRDVGMFLGGALGALALMAVVPLPGPWETVLTILPGRGKFLSRRMKPFFGVLLVGGVLMTPLIVDGFYQLLTDYESNNAMRIVTGICFGFGFFYGIGAILASSIYGYSHYSWPIPMPMQMPPRPPSGNLTDATGHQPMIDPAGQKELPEQPDIPGQKELPGQPDIPGQKELPGQPDIPGQKELPGQPDIPVQQDQAPVTTLSQTNGQPRHENGYKREANGAPPIEAKSSGQSDKKPNGSNHHENSK